MGAGRSGTTALATLLNGSSEIQCLGELHHLPNYINNDLLCSCGSPLSKCEFWSKLPNELHKFKSHEFINQQTTFESHKAVFPYLLKKQLIPVDSEYAKANSALFSQLNSLGIDTVLDSAKYVGRALALHQNADVDLRVIYMMRDPRGVAYSFSKNVQTQKGAISTCFYYWSINLLAMLAHVFVLRKKVLKIRYEDILSKPSETLDKIALHTDVDLNDVKTKILNSEGFDVGHIVGGNRLKTNKQIKLRNTDDWKLKVSFSKSWLVYVLTLPLNILNRYKP